MIYERLLGATTGLVIQIHPYAVTADPLLLHQEGNRTDDITTACANFDAPVSTQKIIIKEMTTMRIKTLVYNDDLYFRFCACDTYNNALQQLERFQPLMLNRRADTHSLGAKALSSKKAAKLSTSAKLSCRFMGRSNLRGSFQGQKLHMTQS